MAEVLITLGIIGVVAAMTIPTLMAKYQEIQTVQKVKKFYSTISQAFQLAREENGDVDSWDFSSRKNFGKNFIPNLKVAVDCGSSNCDKYMSSDPYDYLNGAYKANYNTSDYYKMVLQDGSFLFFRTNGNGCNVDATGYENVCAYIWYDINGKSAPNVLGKDTFNFWIMPQSVIPHPSMGDCHLHGNGYGCAKYIIRNNNMDYLKK